jgi:polysaccharide biosynthesis transport protein
MHNFEQRGIEIYEPQRPARYLPISPTDAEVAEPHLTARHYLAVVLRQKWRILGFVLLSTLGLYLYASRQTPVYEATAVIEVDRQAPAGILGPESGQALGNDDSDQFLATQAELIKSDAVVRPVAEKFDLLNKERELAGQHPDDEHRTTEAPVVLTHLAVTRGIDTFILRISYRSFDRQLAADVANAVAESYLKHTFEIRIRSSSALSAFMEKQLEELRARMERSNLALAKFEQALNVIDPETRTNILSSRLVQLNTEFTAAQADRVRKEAEWKAVQDGSLASAQVSLQGTQLTTLYDRLNAAKQRFAIVASTFGRNHPEYRKAENDLTEVQRQFEEMRRNVAQRVETEYKEAQAKEGMLAKAVSEVKAEWDATNGRSFEYQRLKRDADADKALYSDLERRIREAGINAGFQNSSVRIADYARPPAIAVLPRAGRTACFAFFFSAILALGVAILADVLDNSIREPEQASRVLNVPVISTLPATRELKKLARAEPPLLVVPHESTSQSENELHATGSSTFRRGVLRSKTRHASDAAYPNKNSYRGMDSYEEAIRTLRHSILLPDFDRSLRSLLLTSAAPGEGKSTAMIHLAVAHAEQGKRTLIIDADLRRPTVHRRLNVDGICGLTNVLLGEMSWRETAVRTDLWPYLDVLPAGTAMRRASDLIGPMMAEILDQASKEYDLIFVDAPPLLGFAESMQIATAVDGVVVIGRAGQTSRRDVATVLATLRRLRANVIGLVLNEFTRHSSHKGYYYGDYRSADNKAASHTA